MKNLIKLLAIIAMITVSASNVCAQIKLDTVLGSNQMVYIKNGNKDAMVKVSLSTTSTSVIGVTINGELYTIIDYKPIDIELSVKKNDTIILIPLNMNGTPLYVKITTLSTVGINNNLLAAELNLYSYDNMVVLENKATPKPLSVNIYNLSGQLVVTENVDGLSSRNEISTTLPNGIYMVHVSDGVNTMVKKLYISK